MSSPKYYNLSELEDRRYDDVIEIYGQGPGADTAAKNVIMQAFREAAEEFTQVRPANKIFNLSMNALGVIIMANVVNFAFGSPVPMPVISVAVAVSGISAWLSRDLGDIHVEGRKSLFCSQLLGIKDGYAINPEAEGNKEVFDRASKKLDEFIEIYRPGSTRAAAKPAAPRV